MACYTSIFIHKASIPKIETEERFIVKEQEQDQASNGGRPRAIFTNDGGRLR